MRLPRYFAAICAAMIALAQNSNATGLLNEVSFADGSRTQIRLLPVSHDPDHAAIVEDRLARESRDLTLPANYNVPAELVTPVRDQGQRGTCAYFATVALLESYLVGHRAIPPKMELSVECLVDLRNWEFDEGASKYKGEDRPTLRPDPNGDFPYSIMKTISMYGIPEARQFNWIVACNYNGEIPNGRRLKLPQFLSVYTDAVRKPSLPYGKGARFDDDRAPTIQRVKELLSQNIPVEIGILVWSEFLNTSDWRFDPKKQKDKWILGAHAVMLTGYETVGDHTIFKFKNSWGTRFGKRGYGTISDDVLIKSWTFDKELDEILSLHD